MRLAIVGKFTKKIDQFEDMVLITLLVIMLAIIFIATVARFTNLFVITWAEELARYCMIWIVFIGISVAARHGEHFAVEALDLFLPKKVLDAISVVKTIFVVAFNFFAAYWGMVIVNKQMMGGQVSPSLRVPIWSMYLIIPIGLALMGIRSGVYTYEKIKNRKIEEKGGIV